MVTADFFSCAVTNRLLAARVDDAMIAFDLW